MDIQVERAVLNNVAWCGMVCAAHGINPYFKENLWGLHSKAPTFYPEIITTSRNATIEEVKSFIENGEVSSIKDSFANLNLIPIGFKILFEAEWIFHPSVPDLEPLETPWHVITTEKDLTQWTITSGLEDVIKPDLLKTKEVKIFISEKNDGVSGFIANLSANVVGISNVFSVGKDMESLWRDIPKIISFEFPGLAMGGYEHDCNLTAAHLSGWTSIGPLRVWIKS